MKIATSFNYYFAEILPSLSVFKWPKNITSFLDNLDIIDSISFLIYKTTLVLQWLKANLER